MPHLFASTSLVPIKNLATARATFVADTDAGIQSSPYTFTSHTIGTAASNRYILVTAVASNIALATGSCTVAGQSMTRVLASSTSSRGAAMFVSDAAVTTGTTADIILTVGATADIWIGVYTLIGASSPTSPDDTQTDTTNPLSVTPTVSTNGTCVGVAVLSDAGNMTWGGLTEDGESTSTNFDAGCASINVTSSSTPTVTATSGGTGQIMLTCAWGP